MIKFVELERQQLRIKDQIDQGIAKVLAHGQYIGGAEVADLEDKLSQYTGAKYCISCANGTDALQVALMSLGIGPGDEVIVPAFSFVATAEVVLMVGANIVYVDIEPDSFNIDASKLEVAISDSTKAIIAVSLYGRPAEFEAIEKIANARGIPVIEDGAQSFGASYYKKKSGNLSTISCTSFFPSKPLGCYGDGGAIFTSDDEIALSLRQICNHGQETRYHHVRLGVNSRLDSIQAAILLVKLEILDEEISMRSTIAERYCRELANSGLVLPKSSNVYESAWAQYTIRVSDRAQFQSNLHSDGIPTAVHYPRALHQQEAVADARSEFPESEKAAREVLSIPIHAYLTVGEQEDIINAIQNSAK